MKITEISLRKEPYKSFVVHVEHDPFAPLHHHPEYELVLINRGRGRRIIGDNIERFRNNDLIFVGPYLPHQWICETYGKKTSEEEPGNEAFVIQFNHDFLGDKFFDVPENLSLKKILKESVRGYKFYGRTKSRIISILHEMFSMDDIHQLYSLFRIFEIMDDMTEYNFLATPNFINKYYMDENKKENRNLQKIMQYILQNFQHNIQIKDLLAISNMSYASFYLAFKRAYKVPFKDFLLNVRIGYACKLLIEGEMNISEIAYDSGFENLSNFNRQFKKIKGVTPSQYKKHYESVASERRDS